MSPPSPLPENPEAFLSREISLYQELLEVLEQEFLALAEVREEDLFKLAAAKEEILGKLLEINQARPVILGDETETVPPNGLARLKQQVKALNFRNRETVALSLEVIHDFLSFFRPLGAGTYHRAGEKELAAPASFCRRA